MEVNMKIISFHNNLFPPYTHTSLEASFETLFMWTKDLYFLNVLFYAHECFPAGL